MSDKDKKKASSMAKSAMAGAYGSERKAAKSKLEMKSTVKVEKKPVVAKKERPSPVLKKGYKWSMVKLDDGSRAKRQVKLTKKELSGGDN